MIRMKHGEEIIWALEIIKEKQRWMIFQILYGSRTVENISENRFQELEVTCQGTDYGMMLKLLSSPSKSNT